VSDTTICEKYLEDKDELLFEVYATGKISKFTILFDIICAVFIESFDHKEKHYILGISTFNIYVIYLGKYYRHDQIPENVVPKKVEIVKIKSTNSVSISSVLAGMSYRVKFKEQRHSHTYYIGKEFINKQQLQRLKEMIM